jgi:hypothetical protein
MTSGLRRQHAAKQLIATSALNGHPHIERCVDLDSSKADLQALDDWCWSSGELVLIELLKVLLNGHGNVEVEDLWMLDSQNRQSAILALRIAMTDDDTYTDFLP